MLYSVDEGSIGGGDEDCDFRLYLIPKARESQLRLPVPPQDPDADGSRWMLEKTGTEPGTLADMKRIIETELKQRADDVLWLVDGTSINDLNEKRIYLSALIVQDRSKEVKRLIRSGFSEQALEQLVKHPKLADCMNVDGLSCTEVAARSGDLKVLRALIEQDPQRIDRKTIDLRNLLHHAASADGPNIETIQFLCSHVEERFAEQRDLWAYTPLQVALKWAVPENVECLLPYTRQHLEAPSSGKGEPATCTAIDSKRLCCDDQLDDVVKLLLESVSVDSQDHRGWTALRFAAYADEEAVWELLLREFGADPNIRDFHGSTATAHACQHLSISYLGILEKESRKVIDWWSIDGDGDSPLSLAQRNEDREVARLVATKIVDENALQALEFFSYDPIVCADILTSLENYRAAIERLEQAGPRGNWEEEALRLHKIARLNLEINTPEAAEALLERSLAMYHDMQNEPPKNISIACMHTTLARAFLMQNKFANALSSIGAALAVESRDHDMEILLELQRQAKQGKVAKGTLEELRSSGSANVLDSQIEN